MRPKRIGLIGFENVNALHLVGPAEAFCAAALDDGYGGRIPCYDVHTLGVDSLHFRAESSFEFQAEVLLDRAPEFDTIVVAGGSGILKVRERISSFLQGRIGTTRRLGTVCSGLYALASTGLLEGREVTVGWRCARDLASRFPKLRVHHRLPFVQDGPFYTSSGLSAGFGLSLGMIREDYGPYVAQAVERDLRLPSSVTEEAEPATVPALSERRPNERFADLVPWIVRNLHGDLSVEILARRACMCPNHFSKAFKSVFGQPPSLFIENLRLNEAHRRLTKRHSTIMSVAASVGFDDPAAFQRAYARRFGARPSQTFAAARA